MSKYVIDAWAWIEYFKIGDPDLKSKIESNNIATSAVTVAEVASKFSRDKLNPDDALNAITSLSEIMQVDAKFAKNVGILHSSMKKTRKNFSLADAFVLHTARTLNAKVLTGDPDFKGLKDVVMLTK